MPQANFRKVNLRKKDTAECSAVSQNDHLAIHFLLSAGSFALLATLDAGALIALTLTEFGKHTGLSAGTLKAAQSIVQRLIRLHADLRHFVFPPSMYRHK